MSAVTQCQHKCIYLEEDKAANNLAYNMTELCKEHTFYGDFPIQRLLKSQDFAIFCSPGKFDKMAASL